MVYTSSAYSSTTGGRSGNILHILQGLGPFSREVCPIGLVCRLFSLHFVQQHHTLILNIVYLNIYSRLMLNLLVCTQVGRLGPSASRNVSVQYYDPGSITYRNVENSLSLPITITFIRVSFCYNL